MSKVVTFFGGDSGVGTSVIAQDVAVKIAKSKKVLLLMASSKYGDDLLFDSQSSIDNIRPNLISGQISQGEFDALLIKKGNLSILPGTIDIKGVMQYDSKDLKKLIKQVEKAYEYIVVDGGSDPNYPLSIGALEAADKIYFIITPNYKVLRRYKNFMDEVALPLGYKGKIILNKYDRENENYNLEQVEGLIKGKIDFEIRHCRYGFGQDVESEELLATREFEEQTKKIGADIVEEIVSRGIVDENKKGSMGRKKRIFFG